MIVSNKYLIQLSYYQTKRPMPNGTDQSMNFLTFLCKLLLTGFPLHSESAIPTFGTGRRFLAFIATQYNNPPSTPPTVL